MSSAPEKMLALAEKCESITDGEIECGYLSSKIAFALGWKFEPTGEGPCHEWWISPDGQGRPSHPQWTTSLDAASTLVPQGWDWSVEFSPLSGFMDASANVWPNAQPFPVDLDITCEGTTPALALCAATMRARASLLQSTTLEDM